MTEQKWNRVLGGGTVVGMKDDWGGSREQTMTGWTVRLQGLTRTAGESQVGRLEAPELSFVSGLALLVVAGYTFWSRGSEKPQ